MSVARLLTISLRALLLPRAVIAAENVALRQQLAVLELAVKRPRLRQRDRIFWVWLSKVWSGGRSILLIVQPETVLRWHRQGLRLYWSWKSRKKPGRPKIAMEIRQLIRRMSRENPTWGSPRIQSELHWLGYDIAKSTVEEYMCRHRRRSRLNPLRGRHRRPGERSLRII